SAARRHRDGDRPDRRADGRSRLDPRRHRLPQDRLRRRPADRRSGPRRHRAAARARGPFDRRAELVSAQERGLAADAEDVEQLSLPYRIALVALVVVGGLWFVVLRPKSGGEATTPPATTAPGVTGLKNDVDKAKGAVATSNAAAAGSEAAANAVG